MTLIVYDLTDITVFLTPMSTRNYAKYAKKF